MPNISIPMFLDKLRIVHCALQPLSYGLELDGKGLFFVPFFSFSLLSFFSFFPFVIDHWNLSAGYRFSRMTPRASCATRMRKERSSARAGMKVPTSNPS